MADGNQIKAAYKLDLGVDALQYINKLNGGIMLGKRKKLAGKVKYVYGLILAVSITLSSVASAGDVFDLPVDYDVEVGMREVTLSDFNGDGKPDIATANWGSYHWRDGNIVDPSVSIYFGNGDGTFQERITQYIQRMGRWGIEKGNRPIKIASGDFNGDGKIDLALSSDSSDPLYAIYIMKGNGDGTFAEPYYPLPQFNLGWRFVAFLGNLKTGDFNGDGMLDLIAPGTGWPSATIAVFIGKGDGTFSEVKEHRVGVNAHIQNITTGDFNNDGSPDITFTIDKVYVLINNGDGTFQQSDYSGIYYIDALESIDTNGDGNLDIAVTNRDFMRITAGVHILEGNGDGTFQIGTSLVLPHLPYEASAGDFNCDGAQDLVTLSSGYRDGYMTLSLNGGDGTYEEYDPYLLDPKRRHSWWESVAADISGDGIDDVIVSVLHREKLSVVVNTGNACGPKSLADIVDVIDSMLLEGEITNGGVANALMTSLDNAQRNLETSPVSGENMLEATIKKIEAQAGKKISTEAAEKLIGYLTAIIEAL